MRHTILLWAIAILFLSGCIKKEFENTPQVENFNSLIVPEDFDYRSTSDIEATFFIADGDKSIIEIYDGIPGNGGELIKKGVTGSDNYYNASFVLPIAKERIYVVRRSFSGVFETSTIEVASNVLHGTFGNGSTKSAATVSYLVSPGTWPDCSSSYDYDIPNNYSGDLNIPANKTWRIDVGNSYDGELDFPSWGDNYLIVCGTCTINDVKSGKGTVIVTSTGVLNIEDDLKPNWGSNLINYGTVQVKAGSSWKEVKIQGGDFENHGTLSCGKLQILSSDFLNLGTLNLDNKFYMNTANGTNDGTMNVANEFGLSAAGDVFENYDNVTVEQESDIYGTINNYSGTMYFEDDLELKGGSYLNNQCKLIVDGELKLTDDVANDGYIECGDKLDINSASEITMGEGSLISTEDLDCDGDFDGPASAYAKIDISDETKLNWGASVQGKIDICDDDGTIETNNASIGANVTYCVNDVPSSDCVPGNGVVVADADNDGVPDSLDEYPNDPARAFNSYYPNASTFASLGFEDLWPSKGDYDFNDLVIDFQYKFVSNGSNNIVDIVGEFQIQAVGATFANGFGVSFDMAPATVSSVTGTQLNGSLINVASNGLESGHANKSVVIVYDDINSFAGAMINTAEGETPSTIPSTTVTITLGTPQSSVGTEPFNPFIFVNQARGHEVHLINKPPTDLVNSNLFGNSDDASNGVNVFYKTISNYPWAIEVPQSFDHMLEKQDIVSGHLKFAPWAESGGSSFPDWFTNQTGYRNTSKIY